MAAGSGSEEEPAEEQMRMTFLGTKHSKPQQRGVLSALQEDHPVGLPCCKGPLQPELHTWLASADPVLPAWT